VPSKLAFVTGASKGIGRAVALEAANCGLDVIITGRNKEDLKSLKDEISRKGQHCYNFSVDLNNFNEIEKLEKDVTNSKRKISLLVHSAGVAQVGCIREMSIEDWEMNIKTNLTAPFIITQKLLPLMVSKSHIIFINSVAGRQSFPEWSSYCASKFGLKAFADCLRSEITSDNIKVTTIFPASVDTPMQDSLPYDWDRTKMLKPKDVAKAVMHCFSQPNDIQIKEFDIENCAGTF